MGNLRAHLTRLSLALLCASSLVSQASSQNSDANTGSNNRDRTSLALQAQKAIVYIKFDVADADTGDVKPIVGTGFVVTDSGAVLTASHLFTTWRKQTEAGKSEHPIKAILGSAPGEGGAEYTLDIESLSDPEFQDIAVLSIRNTSGKKFEHTKYCSAEAGSLQLGDNLFAYGFPQGGSFQPVNVVLGIKAGPSYHVSGSLSPGMSGGPILNSSGYVVALVRGGLAESSNSFITPITTAEPLLSTPMRQDCPNLRPAQTAQMCRTPTNGIESYAKTSVVTRASGWRGGGYDQARWCNDLVAQLKGSDPQAIYTVVGRSEESHSTCSPFNCPQYQYSCSVQVQSDPVYKLAASEQCK